MVAHFARPANRKSLLMHASLRSLVPLFCLTMLAVTAAEKTAPVAQDKPKTDYPLTTCVVSDEKLGGMGQPVEYVYKEAGKPDRVVLLCCKDCVKDFEHEPAKYLAKVDAAAKAAPKQPAPAADHAPEHKH
jgi:hypothetical protein